MFVLAYKIHCGSPEACEGAIREFEAAIADARRVAVRGAHAVMGLQATGAHFYAGAASIAHLGELKGVSAYEARQWANLGAAIAPAAPGEGAFAESLGAALEAQVLDGAIPVSSAAVLGEIRVAHEATPKDAAPSAAIVRPGDDWVAMAITKSTRDFRRLYGRRLDEVRAGEAVTSVTAFVTSKVREDLDRAKTLISRTSHVAVTLGQALGVIVDAWLAEHDPMRVKPGQRRLPDTAEIPGSRYVPAEVDRAIRARTDDRCIVPMCGRTDWLHRSHRVAHAEGGSRESWQLDLLCDHHHALYERGLIRITGPADDPTVTDARGQRLDVRSTSRAGPVAGSSAPPPRSISGDSPTGTSRKSPPEGTERSASESAASPPSATDSDSRSAHDPPIGGDG